MTTLTLAESSNEKTRTSFTHPFYWSVRRELWENKSIYLAPVILAVIQLVGFAIFAAGLPARRQAALHLDPAAQRAAIEAPYEIAGWMMIFTAFIVGAFYCLDALYGERRDRSILFLKSLPVSDRTTVLAKAAIPWAVLPLITFVVVVATQLLMLLITTIALLVNGMSPATTWTNVNFLEQALILLYTLVALTLWHAPIYGWFLLVSAWTRRATFLWAVLPWLGLAALEKIAFQTSRVGAFLGYRLTGWMREAFDLQPHLERGRHYPSAIHSLSQLAPRFLSTTGLWLGLAVAFAFLLGAIRLRRSSGPL